MRKAANLIEKDKIRVALSSDKEIEAISRKHEKTIRSMVNAVEISYAVVDGMEESEIDGRLVKMKIEKV